LPSYWRPLRLFLLPRTSLIFETGGIARQIALGRYRRPQYYSHARGNDAIEPYEAAESNFPTQRLARRLIFYSSFAWRLQPRQRDSLTGREIAPKAAPRYNYHKMIDIRRCGLCQLNGRTSCHTGNTGNADNPRLSV
jgi:hypothetical protein